MMNGWRYSERTICKEGLTMYIYSDEDNAPMLDYTIPEYTGYINDRLFRQTGILIVEGGLNDDQQRESA